MSTKIYSGYILDEGMNPFEMIPSLKKEFVAPIKKSIYEMYLRFFFRYYDFLTYNDGQLSYLLKDIAEANKDSYLGTKLTVPMASLLAKAEVEKRVAEDGYSYQVEVLFAQDPKTQRYLVYFMGNNPMEDKFRKMDGVSDYCYYNNTDEPEDVTEEEWAERGRAWDRSVNLDEALVNSMLSLQIVSSFDRSCHLSVPEMMKVEPSFPDREERIESLVNTLLMEAYFKENPDKKRDYKNILKAQADTVLANKIYPEVQQKLGEDITPEDLHRKIQEAHKL